MSLGGRNSGRWEKRVGRGPALTSKVWTLTTREELKLCTSASASEKDGAGVADDFANLDCMGFTAHYTATSSKPVVGDSSTLVSSVP